MIMPVCQPKDAVSTLLRCELLPSLLAMYDFRVTALLLALSNQFQVSCSFTQHPFSLRRQARGKLLVDLLRSDELRLLWVLVA